MVIKVLVQRRKCFPCIRFAVGFYLGRAVSHKNIPGCLDGGIDQSLMNEHLIRLFNSIAVDTQLFHQLALRGQLKAVGELAGEYLTADCVPDLFVSGVVLFSSVESPYSLPL